MLRILWRLTRGYRLRPWRSPYLRWRIETYSGIPAPEVTFRRFWRFVWNERHALIRYLRWAERLVVSNPGAILVGGRARPFPAHTLLTEDESAIHDRESSIGS